MNNDYIFALATSELANHMSLFLDVYGDEAEASMRTMCNAGYKRTLIDDKTYLEKFLNSSPDLIWVRDFVEIEMNQSLSDPTGEAQFRWLQDALARMEKVLAENEG